MHILGPCIPLWIELHDKSDIVEGRGKNRLIGRRGTFQNKSVQAKDILEITTCHKTKMKTNNFPFADKENYLKLYFPKLQNTWLTVKFNLLINLIKTSTSFEVKTTKKRNHFFFMWNQ